MNGVRYGLLIVLPAVLLTATGLGLLVYAQRTTREVVTVSYVREADRVARSLVPGRLTDDLRPVFHWGPDSGLKDSFRLSPALQDALARTNVEWRAEGRKARSPKIGYMVLAGEAIAWRRLPDGTYVGGVIEAFENVAAPLGALFGLAGVMVVGLGVILVMGAKCFRREVERARRAEAQKVSFLSNCSHELKTPLAAIRLWGDLLLQGKLSPARVHRALETIVAENGRMIRLVENLLDCTRLEQKRRVFREEELDVRELARETMDWMKGSFPEEGVVLMPGECVPARADADAVRQVLINLLSNAAKYAAASGRVEIYVSRVGGRVRLEVADRGPGIPFALRERVFERFFRVDGELTRTTGGLGVGLSLSRALARGMGGDLTLASREGGGCVFILEIPSRNAV